MSKIRIIPKSEVLDKIMSDPSDELIGLVNKKINESAELGNRITTISINEGLTQKNYLPLGEKIRAAGYSVVVQYANGCVAQLDIRW